MELFASVPSSVTVRLGAGVMLNMKSSVADLTWYEGVLALFRSSSCQPKKFSEALIRPSGSLSLIAKENS